MLEVKIEDGEIVIRLPFEAFIFATEQCDELATFVDEKNDFRKVKVSSVRKWAEAVVRELRSEGEDGTTLVHLMFDKAILEAVEQGAEGIWIEGISDENEPTEDAYSR